MFCDYCDCEDCQDGASHLYHALTADGSWICNVCFAYDVCTSDPIRSKNGPCDNEDCIHRPRLKSEWLPFKV